MEAISKALKDLMAGERRDEPVPVHIMLDADVSASDAEAILAEIRQHLSDPEALDYLRHMRMALSVVPLHAVEAISHLPGVVSIDLDSEASLAELLD